MKIGLILLTLVIASSACAYPGGWHMMNWGHMDTGYGGVIMWIILLALIAIAVYFLVSGKKLIKKDEETPYEILQRRYAKGEISKQEFERMKKDLF